MANSKTATSESPDISSFTVRLAGPVLDSVRVRSQQLGISMNEYIRRAIGTEDFLQSQKDQGARILIEDPSKQQVREVILR